MFRLDAGERSLVLLQHDMPWFDVPWEALTHLNGDGGGVTVGEEGERRAEGAEGEEEGKMCLPYKTNKKII